MKHKYISSFISIFASLLLISFITFGLMNLSADDPIAMKMQMLGANYDADLIVKLRNDTGLDEPFLIRYGSWLFNLLQGNFGNSIFYGAPVITLLAEALPNTIILVLAAVIISVVISLPLSLWATLHHNRLADYVIRLISMVGISMPSFLLGLILMYIFALKLQWLRVTENSGITGLILPAITLAIWISALYIRRLRASFLEELNKDYIVGVRALGLRQKKIIFSYLIPNGLISVLPMIGVTLGSLLGGATIIETIFGWHGIGYLMVQAILTRDYPLMQGYIIWAASIFIIINVMVEQLIALLMPYDHIARRNDYGK